MNKSLSKIKVIASIIMVMFTHISFAENHGKNDSELAISDSTFTCIRDMTKVRDFYVGNIKGDLDKTIEIASSSTGGVYPAGSVIQLVPSEAMIKHEKGHSPETNDWEFFELNVTKSGSKIKKRGYTDVVNRFGGNCLDCHIKAEPQWDLVCDTGHGCDPIPLTKDMINVIQKTAVNCENTEPLSEKEVVTLKQLHKAMAAMLKNKPSK